MTTTTIQDRLNAIESALGVAAASDDNPCGAVAYHDDGKAKPWRIADDSYGEACATFEEALTAASDWLAGYLEAVGQDG